MIEAAITLVWFLCTMVSTCPDVPYMPADEMHCAQKGDHVCCELTHVLDRYCCPADDLRCEDDCSAAERATDRNDALRSVETWCLTGLCAWELESYGWI